jgi:hypothetical protein
VRPRWQEWVIALSVVALGVTGVWTIWGADIARLFHPEAAGPSAPAPATATPVPPGGPAQGPF